MSNGPWYDDGPEPPPSRAVRTRDAEWRKKRRRRRVVGTLLKLVFWALLLAGVFILGIGFGKISVEANSGSAREVTLNHTAPAITHTQPEKTITETKTVVKTKTVRIKGGKGR